MRGVTRPRLRRHRPGAAAIAYSHALAVLQDPAAAESVAVSALRRGAHSRIAVLAHARYLAIEQAQSSTVDADVAVARDVREVATQLAAVRPAVERSIVDLDLRYGLDSASLARALGLTNERASERVESTTAAWASNLDPALMAWFGPGSCLALASVLEDAGLWPRTMGHVQASMTGPIPVLAPTGTDPVEVTAAPASDAGPVALGSLLSAAPAVLEHAQDCDVCGQRLRMVTPVRSILGNLPVEVVPPAVAAAAHSARRRLPGPLPPSIEPRRLDPARLRTIARALVGVGVVVLGGWGLFNAVQASDDTQARRVAKLVDKAPMSRLLGTPTVVTAETKTAALANNGTQSILWRATTSASWVTVEPSEGRLAPSLTVSLAITAKNPPPNSPSDATITITGDDGSKQVLKYDPNGG